LGSTPIDFLVAGLELVAQHAIIAGTNGLDECVVFGEFPDGGGHAGRVAHGVRAVPFAVHADRDAIELQGSGESLRELTQELVAFQYTNDGSGECRERGAVAVFLTEE